MANFRLTSPQQTLKFVDRCKQRKRANVAVGQGPRADLIFMKKPGESQRNESSTLTVANSNALPPDKKTFIGINKISQWELLLIRAPIKERNSFPISRYFL